MDDDANASAASAPQQQPQSQPQPPPPIPPRPPRPTKIDDATRRALLSRSSSLPSPLAASSLAAVAPAPAPAAEQPPVVPPKPARSPSLSPSPSPSPLPSPRPTPAEPSPAPQAVPPSAEVVPVSEPVPAEPTPVPQSDQAPGPEPVQLALPTPPEPASVSVTTEEAQAEAAEASPSAEEPAGIQTPTAEEALAPEATVPTAVASVVAAESDDASADVPCMQPPAPEPTSAEPVDSVPDETITASQLTAAYVEPEVVSEAEESEDESDAESVVSSSDASESNSDSDQELLSYLDGVALDDSAPGDSSELAPGEEDAMHERARKMALTVLERAPSRSASTCDSARPSLCTPMQVETVASVPLVPLVSRTNRPTLLCFQRPSSASISSAPQQQQEAGPAPSPAPPTELVVVEETEVEEGASEIPAAAQQGEEQPGESSSPPTESQSAADSSDASAATASPASAATPSAGPAPSTPYLITQEIVESEQRFLHTLRTLLDVFVSPSIAAARTRDDRSMGAVVLDTRVQVLFATVSQLHTLNLEMIAELKAVLACWTPQRHLPQVPQPSQTVGAVFLHYAPLLKLFGRYARDHEVVSGLLLSAAAVKGSPFERYVTAAVAEGRTNGQQLSSLLITPVQRIPRYLLLLEELRRKSPAEERGAETLNRAIAQVGEAATAVNEAIRHREQNEALRRIEARFVPSSRSAGGAAQAAAAALGAAGKSRRLFLREREPPRRLVREGTLRRLTRRGVSEYYFHLFDDCLLYSEETPAKKLKLHRRVQFADSVAITDKSLSPASASSATEAQAQAQEKSASPAEKENAEGDASPAEAKDATASAAATSPSSPPSSPASSASNLLQHAIEVRSPQKSFIVVFRSSDEKSAWLTDLLACVESTRAAALAQETGGPDMRPAGDFVAPVWAQDQEATQCKLCNKEFSLFNRRHHCRRCGAVVCGPCSRNRRMLPSVDARHAVRCCDQCAKAEYEANLALRAQQRAASPPISPRGEPSVALNDSLTLSSSPPSSPLTSSGGDGSDEHGIAPYRRALYELVLCYGAQERLLCAIELFLSEVTYVNELRLLQAHFVQPALKDVSTRSGLRGASASTLHGRVLPPSLLLFLNSFSALQTLAAELRAQLQTLLLETDNGPERPRGWSPATAFGEQFLRLAPLLHLYESYAESHRPALTALTGDSGLQEAFSRYEAALREALHAEQSRQRRAAEAARRKEPEWKSAWEASRAAAAAAAAAAASSGAEATPAPVPQELEVGVLDASALERPINPRASIRLSIAPQAPMLDSHLAHASLVDLLAAPFMRVSGYVRVLSALARCTPAGIDPRLPDALAAVQRSLTRINSALLAGDNVLTLTRLAERFVGGAKEVDLVAPHRRLIKEGTLLRHTRSGSEPYTFHLFSDLLLYSTPLVAMGGKLRIRRRFDLASLHVLDTGRSGEHSLEVRSPQKSFVVLASTAVEKEEWLEAISLAIRDEVARVAAATPAAAAAAAASPRESLILSSAPVWAQDSSVDHCPLCQKKFTLFNRRHHCRACGTVCCGDCSQSSRVIESLGKKEPVRVCDKCK